MREWGGKARRISLAPGINRAIETNTRTRCGMKGSERLALSGRLHRQVGSWRTFFFLRRHVFEILRKTWPHSFKICLCASKQNHLFCQGCGDASLTQEQNSFLRSSINMSEKHMKRNMKASQVCARGAFVTRKSDWNLEIQLHTCAEWEAFPRTPTQQRNWIHEVFCEIGSAPVERSTLEAHLPPKCLATQSIVFSLLASASNFLQVFLAGGGGSLFLFCENQTCRWTLFFFSYCWGVTIKCGLHTCQSIWLKPTALEEHRASKNLQRVLCRPALCWCEYSW